MRTPTRLRISSHHHAPLFSLLIPFPPHTPHTLHRALKHKGEMPKRKKQQGGNGWDALPWSSVKVRRGLWKDGGWGRGRRSMSGLDRTRAMRSSSWLYKKPLLRIHEVNVADSPEVPAGASSVLCAAFSSPQYHPIHTHSPPPHPPHPSFPHRSKKATWARRTIALRSPLRKWTAAST